MCEQSAEHDGLSRHVLGAASPMDVELPIDSPKWGGVFRRLSADPRAANPLQTYSEMYAKEPEVIEASNPEMVAKADAILERMKDAVAAKDSKQLKKLMIALRALFPHLRS